MKILYKRLENWKSGKGGEFGNELRLRLRLY